MKRFRRAERLKILMENANLFTEAAVCSRWGISRHTLLEWKKEFNYDPWIGGPRAWVIAALYSPSLRGADLPAIGKYLDWKNHCTYSDAEILAILRELRREGLALRKGGLWYYNRARSRGRDGASFIF